MLQYVLTVYVQLRMLEDVYKRQVQCNDHGKYVLPILTRRRGSFRRLENSTAEHLVSLTEFRVIRPGRKRIECPLMSFDGHVSVPLGCIYRRVVHKQSKLNSRLSAYVVDVD